VELGSVKAEKEPGKYPEIMKVRSNPVCSSDIKFTKTDH
jgi:hypothetical protein